MKKINTKLSAITLIMVAALSACNDGSGFTSNVTPDAQLQQPVTSTATRNMSQDNGIEISTPDAVDPPASEGIGNLIDGNAGSKFLTFSDKSTTVVKATGLFVLKAYNLISGNDAPERDPASWLLEASNDGQAWVEVDSRNGQSFDSRGLKREFSISENETAYQYYRFNFQNTSGSIFQLGEIELLVLAEKPIVAFNSNHTDPEVSEFVIFSDQSLANPSSLEWTFEGGTPATSTDKKPLVSFSSLGPKTVTLKAINDKGESTLTIDNYIRVWNPAEPWDGFKQPQISFNKTIPEHAGQVILEDALPELESLIEQINLGVAQVLYTDLRTTKVFKSLQFETGEYDFPAGRTGTDEDMVLLFDLNHIVNIHAQGGDTAVRTEIEGVLWHEVTHGYNHVPDSGVYAPGNELHTFLEALANYVRIKAGFLESKRAGLDWVDSWNDDAYDQTSFFLEWVVQSNRNTDFIRLFNQSAADIEGWSFDKAFKSIFGEQRGIKEVFAEYQQYLIDEKGIFPPYPTPIPDHRNFAIDEGVTVEVNATTLVPFGEGPAALVDNHIGRKFNAVLEAPSWLAIFAPDLVPVNDVANVEVTFTLPAATLLNAYALSTGNDNPQRDPTSWDVQGSNDGVTWDALGSNQYPANPGRLTTYHYFLPDNTQAYSSYRLILKNELDDGSVGGDSGRLIQLGEISLWTK